MLGLPYERPAHQMRNYLEVLNAAPARPGLGGRRERRVPCAQPDRRHGPGPQPGAARGPGPGHAPPRRRAGVGNDPLDGRRARHRGARRPAHHEGRGRGRDGPPRGSSSGFRSRSAPTTKWTTRGRGRTSVLGQAEYSPNYQRTARARRRRQHGRHPRGGRRVAPSLDRLRAFRDAGATDLAVRVAPVRLRPRGTHRIARADVGVRRFPLSGRSESRAIAAQWS